MLVEHTALPPTLRAGLRRLHTLFGEAPARPGRRGSWAAWAELVPTLLEGAGWPGHRPLGSADFQVRRRWERLLGELAELGFDGSRPTWAEFVATLRRAAAHTIFAPESTDAPVQIMGAFEASGQSFDAVWFLGVDDGSWPAVGQPHPLLPGWLQREAHMPHSSPDADETLAREATARVLGSAPEVVVSYTAGATGDQARPSALLKGVLGVQCAFQEAGTLLLLDERPLPRLPLELVLENASVAPWPAGERAGGTEILKRQAACPMQSFATRRLGARALEGAEPGLNERDRGSAIHDVLSLLWRGEAQAGQSGWTSLEDLRRAYAQGTVPSTVTHAVEQVFAPKLERAGSDPWLAAYLAVEKQRVCERVSDWLAVERTRAPFTVVEVEAKSTDRELRIGDLPLRVRPDRVDRLADGSLLLLDYKTGQVSGLSSWQGERPSEPQLPLYATYGNFVPVGGVAFAQVRAGETGMIARAFDPPAQLGPMRGAKPLDGGMLSEWSTHLAHLAAAFTAGEAAVDPRDGTKTCDWCPLAGLCRVHGEGWLPEPVEPEANDE